MVYDTVYARKCFKKGQLIIAIFFQKALGVLFLISVVGAQAAAAHAECERIVSLAPSVTEVLFDLELGPQVVGVTRFCRYPPEASRLPQVGGFYDTSIEQVLLKKPSHVFALRESGEVLQALRRQGVVVIELDHSSIRGIKESYSSIATTCGVLHRAQERLASLEAQEAEIRLAVSSRSSHNGPPARTMIVVGRTREGNSASGVYISGKDGYYSEVLRLVGADNVNTQSTIAIPALSAEGILALAPEVIVEIVAKDDVESPDDIKRFWSRFNSVPAVRNKKVFTLRDDFASIPGPRYILLAQKLSQLLHSSRTND